MTSPTCSIVAVTQKLHHQAHCEFIAETEAMTAPFPHALMPKAEHDELARCEFVQMFKVHLANNVRPNNRAIFDRRVAPQLAKAAPKAITRHDVRRGMLADVGYQMWGSLQRTSQELLWDSVGDTVLRELPAMIGKADAQTKKRGSLRLADKGFTAPRYIADVDIHCMPGGYVTDLRDDDLAAGGYYDFGVYWYTMSGLGNLNDEKGRAALRFLDQYYPGLKPRRVLDLGCTVGHSTLPYCDAYPQAEIHAIDVGAPVLRYAHARAEGLGKAVHFAQENAEATSYPSGSFDLVVSHILLHEVSRKALSAIMQESFRLLAPGGVMLHMDVPLFHGMTPYDAFDADWDTYNNNEPCWAQMREADIQSILAKAGFKPGDILERWSPMKNLGTFEDTPITPRWYFLSARKPR